MPLVSVLMPVRDGQRFVDAAVRSVLCASDVELVAVDDGSIDATPSILAGWAARDARVRVITLGAPGGAAAARNRGLAACTGEFVSPLDADDLFVAEAVDAKVAALRADPGAALVAGGAEVIDARGRRLFTRRYAEPPEVTAHLLAVRNPLMHSGVMYRRADALAVGGYAEDLVGSHDYDLWLRLLGRGRIVSLPIVCTRYRWHSEQTTVRSAAVQRAESFANSRRRLVEVLGHEPDPAAAVAALNVARETGRIVDFPAADRLFRELLPFAPAASHARIRELTAELWVNHASRLALAGHLRDALSCLRRAARWSPRAVAPLAARRIAWLAAVRYRERT
ncbi:MAG TPA: glycosyltransferase [Solirubrobacteraceae bacterium]|nr:glycosyltransferase [Solirubrobacteraceae bacterium]